ncbi:MAG TPA: glycoside hydrolase family 65 protein [Firmicutes bacterium]|nr:glycoside hydrolase family 65 protein [Bacillota bacterium]
MKNVLTWIIQEEQFAPEQMQYYETIFTLGNGYLGTRGTLEENYRLRKPGTYIAGLFDEAPNEVTELPNAPDWVSIELELAGERFDLEKGNILAYQRSLDLKQGILRRDLRWESPQGRITKLSYQRFVSMKDQHLMGIRVSITPENYNGTIKVVSVLNGQVTNEGTQHFKAVEECTFGERGIYLINETYQSEHILAMAASHQVKGKLINENFFNRRRLVGYQAQLAGETDQTLIFDKLVTIYTSRDLDGPVPATHLEKMEKVKALALGENLGAAIQGFDTHLAAHVQAWADLWLKADILIEGDDFAQKAIRFANFHLIQMAPKHDYRVSIAAKGLTGEGYRGHVFWDTEIFMLPFFIYTFPEVARNLLMYRYHTLPGALKKAKENGYEGAMYAWESADTGEETTPKYGGLDLKTRKPVRIWCGELEQHISADVPYAVWHYYQATGDWDFLVNYGAEIICQTARFWASRAEYAPEDDCYEINNVMGPDEYSEFVNNNYFTNAMAQWTLRKGLEVYALLEEKGKAEALTAKIGLKKEELANWRIVAEKMRLRRINDLVLLQFDGFLQQKEVDLSVYRHNPDAFFKDFSWEQITSTQVLKQPDVIMLLYLLGDQYTLEEKIANWEFYEPKTLHHSSLGPAIHAVFATEIGQNEAAYRYFLDAAEIDLNNKLRNSEAGLHAATQGGIWQAVVNGFGGVRLKDGGLQIAPSLPEHWKKVSFHLIYQAVPLRITVTNEQVELEVLVKEFRPLTIGLCGRTITLTPEQASLRVPMPKAGLS